MKNNRLFGIIYLLLTNETMTAAQLAAYFEVSVRTIYRDIDALSECHIPVYMSKGKNGGIRLMNHYKLDKALLSDAEQNQILFSLQGIHKLQIDHDHTYDKLKQIFAKQDIESDWFEVDFSVWSESNQHQKNFDIIKNAIINQQIISFSYYGSDAKHTQRKTELYKLYFKHNAWYLLAYDTDKQAARFFKIMRMKHITVTEATFIRKDLSIPKQFKKDIDFPLISLQLLIKKTQAYRVYDEFDEAAIQINDNGDFMINVQFPDNDWIYGYILSYGSDMIVLSPDRVKDEIISRLKQNLNHYL